jgi:Spy/CpxP family protein refolding chaperone
MDTSKFQDKVNEILREIGTVPPPQRGKLVELAQKTEASHNELRKSMESLQESLDYLRFSIKYLLFDLEATRREKAQLQKLLEERGKP